MAQAQLDAAAAGQQQRPTYEREMVDSLVQVNIGHGVFHLPAHYESVAYLGGGTFGAVLRAVDPRTGQSVAIKKLTRAFNTTDDAKRAYREVKLLREFNIDGQGEDVIRLLHLYSPQWNDLESFRDIYIVTELAESNLHAVIHSNPLSIDHVRIMMYQLVRALKYIHSANVIHRDLKPSNIAVFSDCSIRLIDYGLARPLTHVDKQTDYVQTRWYRAPEVVLGMRYDDRSDIWSVGCIVSECLTRMVAFPGQDTVDQFTKIVLKRGFPPAEFLADLHSQTSRAYIQRFQDCVTLGPGVLVTRDTSDPVLLDFLEQTLQYRLDLRPTAAQLLAHPFFDQYHDPEYEPACRPIDTQWERDREIDEWKALLFAEVNDCLQHGTVPASDAIEE